MYECEDTTPESIDNLDVAIKELMKKRAALSTKFSELDTKLRTLEDQPKLTQVQEEEKEEMEELKDQLEKDHKAVSEKLFKMKTLQSIQKEKHDHGVVAEEVKQMKEEPPKLKKRVTFPDEDSLPK